MTSARFKYRVQGALGLIFIILEERLAILCLFCSPGWQRAVSGQGAGAASLALPPLPCILLLAPPPQLGTVLQSGQSDGPEVPQPLL